MKLKIGYIFTSAGLNPDSVQKKVMHQIQYLNTVECECKGLFFTTENIGSSKYNEWIDFSASFSHAVFPQSASLEYVQIRPCFW